jgi:hypothetical protein
VQVNISRLRGDPLYLPTVLCRTNIRIAPSQLEVIMRSCWVGFVTVALGSACTEARPNGPSSAAQDGTYFASFHQDSVENRDTTGSVGASNDPTYSIPHPEVAAP